MRLAAIAATVDLLFVLFGVSIVVFLMIRLIPGDAVQIMLGANTEITPERWPPCAAGSASTSRWSSST